jgi:very-short-patch-repair endonuclease
MKCGHCKGDHPSVQGVRACSRTPARPQTVTRPVVSDLDQIAAHGRAQVAPYDRMKKTADAATRRANPTASEQCLQDALAAEGSLVFRREEEILGYVVDFFFPETNTVVEVDGAHHRTQSIRDNLRDDVLRGNWYAVIRFPASMVMSEPDAVVAQIVEVIQARQKTNSDRRTPINGPVTGVVPRGELVRRREAERNRRALQRCRATLDRTRSHQHDDRVRSAKSNKAKLPAKFRFHCPDCRRSFYASSVPWPQCRKCPGSPAVTCICTRQECGKPILGRSVKRYCKGCDQKTREIRESFGGGLSEYWRNGRHSRGT